jgi:hypothetical protein
MLVPYNNSNQCINPALLGFNESYFSNGFDIVDKLQSVVNIFKRPEKAESNEKRVPNDFFGLYEVIIPGIKSINDMKFVSSCGGGNIHSCTKLILFATSLNALESFGRESDTLINEDTERKEDLPTAKRIANFFSNTEYKISNTLYAFGIGNCFKRNWKMCATSISLSYLMDAIGIPITKSIYSEKG